MKHFLISLRGWTVLVVLIFYGSLAGFAQNKVCFASLSDNTFQILPGGSPTSTASNDFNKDGKLDLVIVSPGNQFISLMIGDGDGKFESAVKIQMGNQPHAITTHDFNADGNPDFAFTDIANDLVMVSFGNGDGTFDMPTGYLTGAHPMAIVTGDLNGDGTPDLATANAESDDVSILIGDGSGAFISAGNFSVGPYPYSLTTADFDGDGDNDIATANYHLNDPSVGDVSVLSGNGTGGFATHLVYPVGLAPTSIVTGDLNGDGKFDLAVATPGTNNMSILMASATPGFDPAVEYPFIGHGNSLTISDFNEDGYADLAATDSHSNLISIFHGDGSGLLTNTVNYATESTPVCLINADMNNDSNIDLIALNSISSKVTVLTGNGTGLFDGTRSITAGITAQSLIKADFNGDGKIDVATANFDSDNFSVMLGNGTGHFHPATNFAAGVSPSSLTASDFNGDGKFDLMVSNKNASSVSMFVGDGAGNFTITTTIPVASMPLRTISGDFNGDSHADVAVLNATSVSILLGNGSGVFAAGPVVATGPSSNQITSADYNTDGFSDLAVSDYDNHIYVFIADGTGGFAHWTQHAVGTLPMDMANADLNGDGKIDIAVANYSSGNLTILKGDGSGSFAFENNYTIGGTPTALSIGDLNGDTLPDIAITNESVNGISVLVANGIAGFDAAVSFGATSQSDIVSGDFDNDGTLDLAYLTGNNLEVLQNNTAILKTVGTREFCPGGNVALYATAGGYEYNWNIGGSGSKDLITSTSGTYNVTITNQSGTCSTTSNAIVVSSPPLVPEPTLVQPTCPLPTGSITVPVKNATDTYSFDNGLNYQATNIKTGLAPGTYQVIVKGSVCNSAPLSVELKIPVTPALAVTSTSPSSCNMPNGTITVLNGSADYSYSFDLGFTYQTSQTKTGLGSGFYWVVIKSTSECYASPVLVFVPALDPPLPSVNVTQPDCNMSTGMVSVNIVADMTSYSFDNGTTYQASPNASLLPGTYQIRQKNDQGCSSVALTVVINDQPAIVSMPVLTLTHPSCNTPGTITVTEQSPNCEYSFDNGVTFGTSNFITGLAEGDYAVIIKSADGCPSPVAIGTINTPTSGPATPFALVNQANCTKATGTIEIVERNATDIYSFDDGVTYNIERIRTDLPGGTYNILTKDIAGCVSTVTIVKMINQPETPGLPAIAVSQPTCSDPLGFITVIMQRADDTYSFDNGENFQDDNNSSVPPGNFNVIIKSVGGCLSETKLATINNDPALPSVPTLVLDQPTCKLNAGAITVTMQHAGEMYSFDDGGSFQESNMKSGLKPGTYRVMIKSVEGCNSRRTSTVIETQPRTPNKPTVTVDYADPYLPVLTSSAAATYQWFRNNIAIPSAISKSATVSDQGFYSVTVTNAEGCVSAHSEAVDVIVTGVGDEVVLASLQLYPNPVTDRLTVNLSGFEWSQDVAISITNVQGATLQKLSAKGGTQVAIEVGHYAGGKYILSVHQNAKSANLYFIKH